jgi:hypothetical protein
MRAWTLVSLCAALTACSFETGEVGTSTSALALRSDRCGTPEPTAADVAEAEAVEASSTSTSTGLSATTSVTALRRARGVTIPVYVHIITSSEGEGDVTALMPAQIDVLNRAYASAGIRFNVVSTEVVQNDAWYTAALGSDAEIEMKTELRQGGPETMNIYTGVNDGAYLGWATYPWSYDDSELDAIYDGVVIHWMTLPGGGYIIEGYEEEPDGVINYQNGDTGTHEVGHWLGLFHTFETHDNANGCEGRGDHVFDTPAELEPQFWCVERDSCTSRGRDPIHNFMDYVDDDCMDHFTFGQNLRVRLLELFYRRDHH